MCLFHYLVTLTEELLISMYKEVTKIGELALVTSIYQREHKTSSSSQQQEHIIFRGTFLSTFNYTLPPEL